MTISTTSIALPALVTQTQAQSVADSLVASLMAELAKDGQTTLDASALAKFDSSALAVILACRRAVLAKGAKLSVTGLPERAQALAKVYGLSDLLH
jgi:phospholipid transport system transporter-binding protein